MYEYAETVLLDKLATERELLNKVEERFDNNEERESAKKIHSIRINLLNELIGDIVG